MPVKTINVFTNYTYLSMQQYLFNLLNRYLTYFNIYLTYLNIYLTYLNRYLT